MTSETRKPIALYETCRTWGFSGNYMSYFSITTKRLLVSVASTVVVITPFQRTGREMPMAFVHAVETLDKYKYGNYYK